MTHTEDDILITTFTKGKHKYVLMYRPRVIGQATRVPCRWAMNPDLNFDFQDAARMVCDIRKACDPPAEREREVESAGGLNPVGVLSVAALAVFWMVVGRLL